MSQLAEILTIQKNLEENFTRKMGELETQIQSAGPAKETVNKVAEEFRTFRELVFSILGLLRTQIGECMKQIDSLETRQRRKTLLFQGCTEVDGEDCTSVILNVLNNKLALKNVSSSSIKECHRLGARSQEHNRPILVRFTNENIKSNVWRAKSNLKGCSISLKEFLTKPRQSIFIKARAHFGMRSCWTQDGIIVIKTTNGTRHKVTAMEELSPLLLKFPKASVASHVSGKSDEAGNLKHKIRK